MTFSGKLAAVQESYKGNYQSARQWVDNLNDTSFPVFKDEKNPLSIAAKEYVNKTMPAVFRNNPLAHTVARSLITTMEMYKLLVKADEMLKNGKPLNGKKPAPKAQRQPTNNDIQDEGGGTGSGETAVTMDDFNKIKAL